jgi:hypothetical protein
MRRGWSEKFVALKVPRQDPLVLLLKVRWSQGKTRSEEGKMMGSGLLAMCSVGKKLNIWAEFCVWRATL